MILLLASTASLFAIAQPFIRYTIRSYFNQMLCNISLMKQDKELFITKYASFDAEKVRQYPWLLQYFEKQHIPQLKQLLEQQEEWELNESLDKHKKIERQPFLECMISNYCHSIDFKYLWGAEINLLLRIEFRNLKSLTFSVDYDCGYLDSIEFLPNLDAPNLEILDLSRMEDGGYSLRPLRRCFFPMLRILDLSSHANCYRDYQRVPEAHLPFLSQFTLYTQDYEERHSNFWKAKMESPFILDNLRQQIKQMSQIDE